MPRIIIPTNDERCWKECVAAIRKNEPWVERDQALAIVDRFEPSIFAPSVWDVCKSEWHLHNFCFSHSVNVGVLWAEEIDKHSGAIILNHDALLETPGGFSSLVAWTDAHPEYGVVSAAIRGACCNPVQSAVANSSAHVIDTDVTVAFVCVYIPRRTLDLIGLLDERLTGYGYDDDLYCTQVRAAGLRVGVYHGCVVEHGSLPSSFRTSPDCGAKMAHNHRLYHEIVREKGLEAYSTHHSWCKETF